MEIISKKDTIEKIEDLNRKGVIKTLSLKKDPCTPKLKGFGWPADKKKWDENYEKIFRKEDKETVSF